jgi:E3 ubiquitin-protein ligase MYCBP2
LPCLNEECVDKDPQLTLGKKADDYCIICFTQGLGEMPCIQLECKHIAHLSCTLTKLRKRWPGPRIVFSFMDCSECKQRLKAPHCPELDKELKDAAQIEDDVLSKVIERAKNEGLDKDERLHK